ncbi:SusC/RagA family TonB-linked outer membrane protein, partial [Bacteroides cellulosilyticus]|uniref:SusC/RagA family TonB-linked outer membrane protein n=1 Tax=Bacteroides cellulosilyticus TaxID=246787 RepID=UPI0032F03AD8
RWSNTLNYDFSLGKAHRFSILAGHEVSDSGGDGLKASGSYYPANFTKENAFAMINQYDGTQGVGQFSSSVSIPGRILSFFSRLNYNLLDRYLLTVTFRADGSSKFSPNNRWGYFPAAALGWRMSEESFLKDVEWLDNLKLRVSYGQVGNDGISSSLWSQTWSATTDVRQQDAVNNTLLPSYSLATELANKDLKWETTITRNIGFDFGFFNNRLTGTIDAYWNTTKDLLMKTTIPGITGFTATYANVGQTSNKGIEIALQGVLVQTKDWNVTAGFNINFNRGNVDELADNVTGLYGTQWASGSTFPSSDYILMEGKPVGLVRGLIADGFYTTSDFTYANGIYTLKEGIPDISSVVFPNYHLHSGMNERPAGQSAYPGMPKFKDRDNNGIINDDDVEVIGDMTPVHTGGFNINTSYKNFDLGLYFNWSYGNEIYNANKLGALYGYKESGVYENKLSLVKDCYKIYDVVGGQLVALTTPEQLDAANVNAKLPLAYSENGYVSTLGIEDGSYLRLNTLTLGYTLPKQFIKKAGISNLRVYGSIYNVFTITGYSGLDAEVNTNTSTSDYPKWGLDWGTYPRARSFVLGVNISF